MSFIAWSCYRPSLLSIDMLVLTRKSGESIIIGKDIVFTVLEAKGDKIKIGIEAPSNIKVYRKEIFDAIMEANIEASKSKVILPENLKKLAPQQIKISD